MGIEVPEQYGGAGGLAHDGRRSPSRRSARSTPSAAIHGRRAEHARELPDQPVRQRRAEGERYLTRLTARHGRRLRAVASRARAPTRSAWRRAPSRRGDGWVLNGRKMWITNGAEAEIFVVFANTEPGARATRASRRSSSSAGLHGLHRRQEGGQARHPRVEHDGAASSTTSRCPTRTCSATSARATRSRSRR